MGSDNIGKAVVDFAMSLYEDDDAMERFKKEKNEYMSEKEKHKKAIDIFFQIENKKRYYGSFEDYKNKESEIIDLNNFICEYTYNQFIIYEYASSKEKVFASISKNADLSESNVVAVYIGYTVKEILKDSVNHYTAFYGVEILDDSNVEYIRDRMNVLPFGSKFLLVNSENIKKLEEMLMSRNVKYKKM